MEAAAAAMVVLMDIGLATVNIDSIISFHSGTKFSFRTSTRKTNVKALLRRA